MLVLVLGQQMIGGGMKEVFMDMVNLMKQVRNCYLFCLQMKPQYVTLSLKRNIILFTNKLSSIPGLINGIVLIT